MLTHIIYLGIIAALFVWLFRLEGEVRYWHSMWHSELNGAKKPEKEGVDDE